MQVDIIFYLLPPVGNFRSPKNYYSKIDMPKIGIMESEIVRMKISKLVLNLENPIIIQTSLYRPLFNVFLETLYKYGAKHAELGSIWIRTGSTPCTAFGDARQVLARHYPKPARFQLCWRGQTFYSTWPIVGLFYLSN